MVGNWECYAGRRSLIEKELYEVTCVLSYIKYSDYSPAVVAKGNTPPSVVAASTHLFVGCALAFLLKD